MSALVNAIATSGPAANDTGRAPRFSLVFLASVLLTFLAASSVPTPLYHLYQETWAFSASMLTLIFAVYAFSLLAALLVMGSLSDYVGRRPVIGAALLLEIVSIGLFIMATDARWLIAARLVQGFATGMATSSLGAALLDCDRRQGPLINSLAPLLGMACGALGSSLLVEFAPAPLRLVYWLIVALLISQTVLLYWLPESVSRQAGVLTALRPKLSVPPQARAMLWRILPVDIAVWAVGGFYLSLVPSLVRAATGSHSSLGGGLVVASLTISGAVTMALVRERAAAWILTFGASALALGVGLVMWATYSGWLWLFFVATIIAGAGFGSGFLGAVRSLMPLALAHERAGLMATFYVLSYLAFCVPALLAGLSIPHFGLLATTYGYGVVVIGLAVLALFAQARSNPVSR